MSIGLYGGPRTRKSSQEKYYDILERLYLFNEHIRKVESIRRAKSVKKALRKYYSDINLTPLCKTRDLTDEKEIILAIDRLKKVLEMRKIDYPTWEKAEERRKRDNRKRMEECQSKGLIHGIDGMDEKTKKSIFGDM